jgi:signal peptidase I
MPRVPLLRRRHGRRLLTMIPIAAIGVVSFVAVASPYLINSISMTSTIEPGQVVLVDRLTSVLGLQRGEIIVFYPPAETSGIPFIKRVIGLPGDHIAIEDGLEYVNGRQLDEPYLAPNTVTRASVRDDHITVPPGTVFVLGDDRTESWDSRAFGPVPDGNIIGQAWIALSPPSFSVALP